MSTSHGPPPFPLVNGGSRGRGSHAHLLKPRVSDSTRSSPKATSLSPWAQTRRDWESTNVSSLPDGHASIGRLPCFRERESLQVGVPQSLDKDYAEDRKAMELVPPSGTEGNCWCRCHQALHSLDLCPLPFFPWKQRLRASFNRAAGCPCRSEKAAVKRWGFKRSHLT